MLVDKAKAGIEVRVLCDGLGSYWLPNDFWAPLIAAGGKKYRIEPKDGVTDPTKFHENGVQLIQNDDTFYSALLHVGAFGIIASYVIEVEPQYWLMEKRTVEKWSEVRKQIENHLFRRR